MQFTSLLCSLCHCDDIVMMNFVISRRNLVLKLVPAFVLIAVHQVVVAPLFILVVKLILVMNVLKVIFVLLVL